MKKIFTLALALMGLATVTNAASIDDVAVCKHSYVLCFDDWDGAGTAKPGKGQLFGNGYFLDVTGGSVATNKGKVNLSVVNEADDNHVTQYIADKYGADYPDDHFNSWRLKNAQDVIAMKVTAKSKLIFFLQGNNKSGTSARIPKIATDAKLENALNAAPDADFPTTDTGFRYEWTATDDMTIYIGSYNGDTFFSYLIVEANEAPGTPTVKVGEQTYENGLWFREVSCKANNYKMEGSDEEIPTIVTYTTDGSAPTASSPVYTAPIKCYANMTVKFQAYQDWGLGADEGFICDGADNDANVNFSFDAPSIDALGANVTITSPYEGAKNFYTLNDGEAQEGSSFTLTESATISAYSQIVNGSYTTFTTNKSSKDVYVLNPIKEKKVIEVIAGDVVLDEEATATSTTGEVYTIQNGEISADKMDFFVKDLTFKAIKDEQYQVPAGNERYIQMSNTNITFQVAEGDSVAVKVICSKNACKNIDAEDAEDGSQVNDRKCVVNLNGTNYTHKELMDVVYKDVAGNDSIVNELAEASDLKLYENANIIEFGLTGGIYTFQKYSGTGNILISSIEITPAAGQPVLADFEDGKYYLINVASNMAWGSGNSWGTQGSLVKHPEYAILLKQEDGTYFMETQVSNGENSFYFNGDFMDQNPPAALTIIQGEQLGEDSDNNPVYAYYITTDGTNFFGWDGTESTVLAKALPAGNENAQWLIVPQERAIDALAEATEEDPVDATFLILDPNFGRNNRNQDAWIMEASNQNLSGGNNENNCAESWQSAFTLSQTIVDVPNGKYVLNAQAALTDYTNAYDGTDYPVIYANDVTSTFNNMEESDRATNMSTLSAAFSAGKYQVKPITVIVTDGKLTVGAKGTRTDTWCIWDNFELEYYGPAAEEPAEPGKLIAEKDWTTETAYPYYNMGVPEGATYDVEDGALVVTNTVKQSDIWGLQLFALDWFNVTQGNDYVVRVYATIPVDGQIQVNMGTWDGADQHIYDVTASQTTKAYDFAFDNYAGATATTNNAHVLWQQGWLIGTVKISKVQLFEVGASGINSTVAEKDFNGAIYNLAGQKVDANFKGVVIKNGKKMLQK